MAAMSSSHVCGSGQRVRCATRLRALPVQEEEQQSADQTVLFQEDRGTEQVEDRMLDWPRE